MYATPSPAWTVAAAETHERTRYDTPGWDRISERCLKEVPVLLATSNRVRGMVWKPTRPAGEPEHIIKERVP